MSAGELAAIVSGAIALCIAAFTLWVTQSPIRRALEGTQRELDECKRDRRRLRQDLELVVAAIVGLLPAGKRDLLLQTIGENVRVDEAA